MNTFAKNFVQAILFSACISVAFGDDAFVEPEQIHPERYDDHGVHYGLPCFCRTGLCNSCDNR